MVISVNAPVGSYPEMPRSRDYTFRYTAYVPKHVMIFGGNEIPYVATGGTLTNTRHTHTHTTCFWLTIWITGVNSWRYDGATGQVVIQTPTVSTAIPVTLVVTSSGSFSDEAPLFGLKGQISRANLAKQTLDPSWSTPGAQIVQVCCFVCFAQFCFNVYFLLFQ
jgi:hypothetical protein